MMGVEMAAGVTLALVVLVGVLVCMLGEARLAASPERRLEATGAVEPAGDVYRTMRWAYPAVFILMTVEGLRAEVVVPRVIAGAAVLLLAKAVKYWAIASLGPRWTFRVLVPPGEAPVTGGPYRWIRHPNYVGVVGEILGFSLLVWAPLTGAIALLGFGVLLHRRIRVEEQALGLR